MHNCKAVRYEVSILKSLYADFLTNIAYLHWNDEAQSNALSINYIWEYSVSFGLQMSASWKIQHETIFSTFELKKMSRDANESHLG